MDTGTASPLESLDDAIEMLKSQLTGTPNKILADALSKVENVKSILEKEDTRSKYAKQFLPHLTIPLTEGQPHLFIHGISTSICFSIILLTL